MSKQFPKFNPSDWEEDLPFDKICLGHLPKIMQLLVFEYLQEFDYDPQALLDMPLSYIFQDLRRIHAIKIEEKAGIDAALNPQNKMAIYREAVNEFAGYGHYKRAKKFSEKCEEWRDYCYRAIAEHATRRKDYEIGDEYAHQAGYWKHLAYRNMAEITAVNRDYDWSELFAEKAGNAKDETYCLITVKAAENEDYDVAKGFAGKAGYLKDAAKNLMQEKEWENEGIIPRDEDF